MDKDILARAATNLNNRLTSSGNYSESEISAVSKLSTKLFSLPLDSNSTELLRGLCASFAINKDFTLTKSHRPIIGPAIYFAKKLLAGILRPLLKTQFQQIENFNRMTVLSIAKLYDANLLNKKDSQ